MNREKVGNEIRSLPVRLLPEERMDRAFELTTALNDMKDERDNEASRLNAHKERMESLNANVDRLNGIVRSGSEYRSVEVGMFADYSTSRILFIRLDTGEEVGTRDMTPTEKQLQFRLMGSVVD